MKKVHPLPWNLQKLDFCLFFSHPFPLSLFCLSLFCCLSALPAHSPAYFPKPSSASTSRRNRNETTCTMAKRSYRQYFTGTVTPTVVAGRRRRRRRKSRRKERKKQKNKKQKFLTLTPSVPMRTSPLSHKFFQKPCCCCCCTSAEHFGAKPTTHPLGCLLPVPPFCFVCVWVLF